MGGSATYGVAFKPGATVVGVRSAVLRVASDDADTPVLDIGLHGLSLNGLEGANEPPLADVVRALGRNINVGWCGLTNDNPATGTQLEGDEVAAPLFTKVGTGPVTIKPVARFSPDEVLPFGWYLPDRQHPERTEVATIAPGQFQTLNPAIVDGGASTSTRAPPASASTSTRSTLQPVELHPGRPEHRRPARGPHLPGQEPRRHADPEHLPGRLRGRPERRLPGLRLRGRQRPRRRQHRRHRPGRQDRLRSRQLARSPTGYTRDGGAAFTTGGSGWVNQATGAPQSMVALTRDRAGTNLNQSTLVLMQPTAAQSPAGPGAWRYTLPNGSYKVTVGVGDPDFFDSVHRINVEGTTVVPNFTADHRPAARPPAPPRCR